jgi:hypothetical protein
LNAPLAIEPDDHQRLIEAARRARRARVALARKDGAEFNAYVLRDDEDGSPIQNGPHHREWHQIFDTERKVQLWSHIEAAKTSSVSVGRTMYELGKNPNLRVTICSNTIGLAEKIITPIKGYMERSSRLHEVFPSLIPGPLWTQTQLTIRGRTTHAKDPSIQACGIHGSILGSRIDLLLLDDILDYENTRTEGQRKELARWYRATLAGRMTRYSRIISVGTAWHPEDLLHELANTPGWYSKRFPVRYPDGRLNWPARWPSERIDETYENLGPLEGDRQLFCLAHDDTSDRFEKAWIDRCLANGTGSELVYHLTLDEQMALRAEGALVVIGVDPASGKTKRKRVGAKTVFFVLLVYPNGDHQPLWVEGGKFSAPEIRDKLIDLHRRYGAPVFVEDNAVQSWMLEIVGEIADIPIYPFTTGSNKADPVYGVESIGVQMFGGKWIIPSTITNQNELRADGELDAWLKDLRGYRPTAHTGDYLMAGWIAKEGARMLLLQWSGGASAELA